MNEQEREALPLQECEREPFEAYMLETGYGIGALEKHGNGHYWDDEVSAAWWAWNRRAALAAQEAPDLCPSSGLWCAAKAVPADLRRAAERTREDLGPTGSNYPDIRVLLAFAEQALAATPPAPATKATPAQAQQAEPDARFWDTTDDMAATFLAGRALAANEKVPSRATDIATALGLPGCERLKEWAEIGAVQRAAVEEFAYALAANVPADLRHAFEALAVQLSTLTLERDEAGRYVSAVQQMLWESFQVRRATAPAPAPEAKPEAQQPLTEEDILDIARYWSSRHFVEGAARFLIDFARGIEERHGIGASGEASK